MFLARRLVLVRILSIIAFYTKVVILYGEILHQKSLGKSSTSELLVLVRSEYADLTEKVPEFFNFQHQTLFEVEK